MSEEIVSCLLGHFHFTGTHLTPVCLGIQTICYVAQGLCLLLLPPARGSGACLVPEGHVLGHAWGSPVCWLSPLQRLGPGVWVCLCPALQTLQEGEVE